MNKIEKARELFRILESEDSSMIGEIALRTFCIEERLAKIKD